MSTPDLRHPAAQRPANMWRKATQFGARNHQRSIPALIHRGGLAAARLKRGSLHSISAPGMGIDMVAIFRQWPATRIRGLEPSETRRAVALLSSSLEWPETTHNYWLRGFRLSGMHGAPGIRSGISNSAGKRTPVFRGMGCLQMAGSFARGCAGDVAQFRCAFGNAEGGRALRAPQVAVLRRRVLAKSFVGPKKKRAPICSPA